MLVGETSIIYARLESTAVDIVGFFRKGYRTGYYCHDLLNPSDVLNDLEEVMKYDPEGLLPVVQRFGCAVLLRNDIAHSVPCGGKKAPGAEAPISSSVVVAFIVLPPSHAARLRACIRRASSGFERGCDEI